MKAIVLSRYGDPEELRLEDVPTPVPGTGEVLVRVHATSVNDWDWGYVRGQPRAFRPLYGMRGPRVRILGAEVAGTVEQVGPGAARFHPGDRVYGDVSGAGFGGFAEFVAVSETAVHPMAAGMSFAEAAALPHAAMLAIQGLLDGDGIATGSRVLINGAGGGVGTLGVQIARHFGAEVTGVDGPHKQDLMRDAGFDHVLDYQRQDFARTGERYDLVLDTRSTRSPLRCLAALRPGGRYATVGGDTSRILQVVLLAPLLPLVTGKRVRLVALAPNRDLDRVNRWYEEGVLAPRIEGPYPLAEVPAAIRRFGEARHLGKIVISVTDPSAGDPRTSP